MTGEIEIMEPESAALERRLRFEKFSHEDGWNTAMKILELYGRKMEGREVKKGIGWEKERFLADPKAEHGRKIRTQLHVYLGGQ